MAFRVLGFCLAVFGSLMIVFGPLLLGLLSIISALFFAFVGEERRRDRRDES